MEDFDTERVWIGAGGWVVVAWVGISWVILDGNDMLHVRPEMSDCMAESVSGAMLWA